jgi:hypothetical protein
MPTRHQLTTEERRRGAFAAAAVKRRKREAAEKIVAEKRAEKIMNRRRNLEGRVYGPLPVYEPRREPSPSIQPIEPIEQPGTLYARSCEEHGVFNCRSCS